MWYYAKNGAKHGPVDSKELKRLADAGMLTREDKIWREGMTDWATASQVKGLFTTPPVPPAIVRAVPVDEIDSAIGKNHPVSHKLCVQCGSIGEPVTVTPGSMLIELILWLTFFVPGLIYSVWRLSARKKVCGSCGATGLISPQAPRAAVINTPRKPQNLHAPSDR